MGNFDPIQGLVQTNDPYNGDHNNFAPRVGFAWDVRGDGKTVVRGGAGILYEQLSFDVMNGEGNLLGLRTFPTGLPLLNAGSTTPLPLAGNIQLQSLTFAQGSPTLNPINAAWQAFNPALPVAGQTTLFSGVSNPACGDGFTQPSNFVAPPGPCEVYGVDRNIRTPYVSNWNLDIQHAITNNLSIDIGYVGNHGTKLLGKLDINQPAPGAGWNTPLTATAVSNDGFPTGTAGMTPAQVCVSQGVCMPSATLEQAALPFTAPCASSIITPGGPLGSNSPGGPFNPTNSCLSYLNYITLIKNIYESNYNGLQVTLTGRNYHGLSFTTGYTFSHALGDASDQGTSANFPVPLNSYGNLRHGLYANTDFDIRHRFTLSLDYAIPGRKGFGQLLEGWSVNTIVIVTSGLPWGLSDQSDDFSGTNVINTQAQNFGEQWNFFGNPSDFTPVHGWTDTNGGWQNGGGGLPFFKPGTPGPGDDPTTFAINNASCTAHAGAPGSLSFQSMFSLGCYAVGSSVLLPPAFGSYGNTNANIFRDTGFKNVDFSVTKVFTIKRGSRPRPAWRSSTFSTIPTGLTPAAAPVARFKIRPPSRSASLALRRTPTAPTRSLVLAVLAPCSWA